MVYLHKWSAGGKAQDSESSPVKDRRSTAVPHNQLSWDVPWFCGHWSSCMEYKIFQLMTLVPIKFNKKDILGLFTNIVSLVFPNERMYGKFMRIILANTNTNRIYMAQLTSCPRALTDVKS